LIEIINKQLLLQLVGYICYWQMGFNSVFKGLITLRRRSNEEICRNQRPSGLRRGIAATRLQGLWVRIQTRAWNFVSCECCVLSGTGL